VSGWGVTLNWATLRMELDQAPGGRGADSGLGRGGAGGSLSAAVGGPHAMVLLSWSGDGPLIRLAVTGSF
jgi:hypothetical protein